MVPLATAAPATVSVQAEPQGASRGGILSRLWHAYRQRRAEAVLRNLADEMDAHMLEDVGAPQWLVNETTREQALKRITSIDNLRW
ncbi:isoleucyl-tRNA synthetase [Achromobacter sp. UMC71]|uniref:isoleucyl-tRNA synthetase n=1 Tax=Achromobacter sp. UMC71 TaxID=1862320 RepID=UPI0021055BC9|nr:isoleucyl-tRNA synthetase [Achromobacter sp. UMC71]